MDAPAGIGSGTAVAMVEAANAATAARNLMTKLTAGSSTVSSGNTGAYLARYQGTYDWYIYAMHGA